MARIKKGDLVILTKRKSGAKYKGIYLGCEKSCFILADVYELNKGTKGEWKKTASKLMIKRRRVEREIVRND